MANVDRRHALFICSEIGDATSGAPIDPNRPSVVDTAAGKMSSITGVFGGLNFAVPVRLAAKARFARHWGMQVFRVDAAEAAVFPAGGPQSMSQGSAQNVMSLPGLRALRAGEAPSTVNGVICMAYSDAELAAARRFYARFANAVMVRLPVASFQQLSWQAVPDVPVVHCVVSADAGFAAPSYNAPILQTYLDQLTADFLAYGRDFTEEFLATTRGWSTFWLQNRIEDLCSSIDDAAGATGAETVDAILRAHAPHFADRRTTASYAFKKNVTEAPETFATATVWDGTIKQKETKFFCLGMGSLINTPSRVGTAGKVAQCAIPVAVSAEYDFCPCWNFQNRAGGSQLTAGGMVLRDDDRVLDKSREMVGVIYPGPTNEEDLAAQDEREVGYTRKMIPGHLMRSLNWVAIPDGIEVFQYIPDTELADDDPKRARDDQGNPLPRATFPSREYPLPQTYVDLCLKGCLEYGAEFAAGWIAGFVGWPSVKQPFWLNDRPTARTPWVYETRFREVDDLLAAELPVSSSMRRLPAEYALFYTDADGDSLDVTYESYKPRSRAPKPAARQSPTHFIFEFDDRIAAAEWERVIVKTSDIEQGIACRLTAAAGYRRTFGLHVEVTAKYTAPTLVSDRAGARPVNGILYAAPKKWFGGQDGQEPPSEEEDMFAGPGVQRVTLEARHFEVLANFMSIPDGARIYTYVAKNPQEPSFDFPVRQTVLDTILDGCLDNSVDMDFAAEWVDTTDGWTSADGRTYWLNDRVIARRPWMNTKNYKSFDRIVCESSSKLLPDKALLRRRLPEEYTLNSPGVSM